jgi:hypothetical protein
MENRNTELLSDSFFKFIKLYQRTDCQDVLAAYKHVFSILDKNVLDEKLERVYRHWQENKEQWFYDFHKSIRQCDFFDDCYRKSERKLLSKEEQSRFETLIIKVKSEGFVKYTEQGFSEEYDEYLRLSNLKRDEKSPESIGGHIDMVLWYLIHMDERNLLKTILTSVFVEREEDELAIVKK